MTITLKSNPDGVSGAIQVNGNDVVAFGNGAQFSFRNKIINGAFGINQRGYVSGAATSAGQYTLDRWKVTGTGGVTFSTVNNKTTVTIPAGQTLQQVIEGLNLATGDYVLSWEGTAQGRIGGGSYGASGSVKASITGGANTTIEFNSGTVANVQLEAGSIATPFEHRPYGAELALCQRYYEKILFSYTNYFNGSNSMSFQIPIKVEKRATSTAIVGDLNWAGSAVNPPPVAPTASSVSTSSVNIQSDGAGVGVVRYSCGVTMSAEL